MGVSVPWKEKHFLIFKDIISDGTSPVPIYHLVQALLCKASECNADKAAQPGSLQPSSRGQALSHRERWQLLSPTWTREYLIMGWTTGLQEAQLIHLQPDTESDRTELTSCMHCQCEERFSEKPTTSSYIHTDIRF